MIRLRRGGWWWWECIHHSIDWFQGIHHSILGKKYILYYLLTSRISILAGENPTEAHWPNTRKSESSHEQTCARAHRKCRSIWDFFFAFFSPWIVITVFNLDFNDNCSVLWLNKKSILFVWFQMNVSACVCVRAPPNGVACGLSSRGNYSPVFIF